MLSWNPSRICLVLWGIAGAFACQTAGHQDPTVATSTEAQRAPATDISTNLFNCECSDGTPENNNFRITGLELSNSAEAAKASFKANQCHAEGQLYRASGNGSTEFWKNPRDLSMDQMNITFTRAQDNVVCAPARSGLMGVSPQTFESIVAQNMQTFGMICKEFKKSPKGENEIEEAIKKLATAIPLGVYFGDKTFYNLIPLIFDGSQFYFLDYKTGAFTKRVIDLKKYPHTWRRDFDRAAEHFAFVVTPKAYPWSEQSLNLICSKY